MNEQKSEEIMLKIETEWKKRLLGRTIDEDFLKNLRQFIQLCPDEDGCKRVVSMETGLTHLVPYEYIILNGLKGDDLHKFPIEGVKYG